VRARLYEALVEVFRATRSALIQETIFEMLLAQLLRYYDPDPSVSPPIHLESCVEGSSTVAASVRKLEPFPHLLNAIQTCLIQFVATRESGSSGSSRSAGMDLADSKAAVQLKLHIDQMLVRVGKAELEEWKLDKSTSFSDVTSPGRLAQECALLLADIYEVRTSARSSVSHICSPLTVSCIRTSVSSTTLCSRIC
jgi:hypothetical protein